ncbi:MAG: MmcQ/YjbR family DNA-binding protein [Candidatus Cloacimonetes bacterium]|nr:MmcQ/YjbR family DNA-binding protein [Candidatus Cloacimonadota bacterium]
MQKDKTTCSEPFGPDVYVFKVLDKMYALYTSAGNKDRDGIWLNLKVDPDDSICLQDEFECIIPGYHMNKKHWITVKVCDEISKDTIIELIDDSYNLIVSKMTKAKQALLIK